VPAALQRDADRAGRLDWQTHFVDGTIVRAHQHAAGATSGPATAGTARSTTPCTASGIAWSG
jgi:hypothetical protein